jgi:hypothetical protein
MTVFAFQSMGTKPSGRIGDGHSPISRHALEICFYLTWIDNPA